MYHIVVNKEQFLPTIAEFMATTPFHVRSVVISSALVAFVAAAAYQLVGCSQQPATDTPDQGARLTAEVLPDAAYVGTDKCISCHPQSAKAWHGSHHHWAMAPATDSTVLADFDNSSFEHLGQTFRFWHDQEGYWVQAATTEAVDTFPVLYTFGVEPLQQFLVPWQGGRLQALTVAWNTEENQWYSLYPSDTLPPGDWLHWTGSAMTWNTMCADCHSTNLRKNFDTTSFTFDTKYTLINVSCEACHGPGERHVQVAEGAGYVDGESVHDHLAMTSNMTAVQVVDQCARCHVRREQLTAAWNHQGSFLDHYVPELLRDEIYYADGQIMDEDYVYGSFVQSKMYHEGVQCMDCHDPHSLELVAPGNLLCGRCHEAATYDTPEHHFHPVGTASAECVNCHMTGRDYMGHDFRRDHSFRVPRPDQSVEFGTPNACTGCHTDQTDAWAAEWVDQWYGGQRQPHFSDVLVRAAERQPEHLGLIDSLVRFSEAPAIAKATALYYAAQTPGGHQLPAWPAALQDTSALMRQTAVEQLAPLLAEPDQRRLLLPLAEDPVRAVRVAVGEAFAHTAPTSVPEQWRQALTLAQQEYRQALAVRADFPGGQMARGVFHQQAGRAELAADAYQKAIWLNDGFHPARVNLALLRNSQGRPQEAIALYQQVLAAEPDYAEGHYSLGLLQAEQQNWDAAATALRKAVQLAGEQQPRYYYNLGLVLEQQGNIRAAEQTLKEGMTAHAQVFDLAYALFALQLNHLGPAAARETLRVIKQRFPNEPRVAQLERAMRPS